MLMLSKQLHNVEQLIRRTSSTRVQLGAGDEMCLWLW